MRGPVSRLLCIAPSWLGDAVLALPAVESLGRVGLCVEVLARVGLGRVFEDVPGVAHVHVTSARHRRARLRDAWRLRGRGYDAALVLAPSFAAALASRLVGARVRVGEKGEGRGSLLTHGVEPAGRGVHLSLAYDRLARAALGALGVERGRDSAAGGAGADLPLGLAGPPTLAARPAERAAGRDLLRKLGVPASPPVLVVAPGARFGPAKRYPPERFAFAAAELAEKWGCAVVLVGESADAEPAAAVRTHLPAAHDLTGRTRLDELIGILAGAAGVLANDSGTMHLAAALGCPTVGVFGSTNPLWTRPLGRRAVFVTHPVECAPCYAPACGRDFACMLGLEPERLVEALQAATGRGETGSAPAGPGL